MNLDWYKGTFTFNIHTFFDVHTFFYAHLILGLRGFSWNPAYSSSKHGVLGLTKSATLQYATKNIRIDAIYPGQIKAPDIKQMIYNDPNAKSEMLLHQPIGRLGKVEEVAKFVDWLRSDDASFITGAVLPVDGGYTAF